MKIPTVGRQIRQYRIANRMTQSEFAALAGVTPQAVSKWECEKGFPDIFMLPVIAHLLGCRIDDLYKECSETFSIISHSK